MVNLLFVAMGSVLALAVLYVFYRNLKKGQEISKNLPNAVPQIGIPKTLKTWFLLTVVSLSIAAFMMGQYVGSHGSPSMSSEEVINTLEGSIVLQQAFPGLDYKTTYYSAETQKWRVYGSNANVDLYIEYDDMLRTISVVNPIPKTVEAGATPIPSAAASVKVDVSKIAASNKPARGDAQGKNTIYMYFDFQCPYCARGEEVMKEVLAKHSTGTKVYFKNYPLTNLHSQAYATALAAECANEQNKFWEFADYALTHQDLLTQTNVAGASVGVLTIAEAVGVQDLTKFAECVGSQKYKAVVDAEAQEAASLGLQGTPGFIVISDGNKEGFVIAGAYPAETFEQYLK